MKLWLASILRLTSNIPQVSTFNVLTSDLPISDNTNFFDIPTVPHHRVTSPVVKLNLVNGTILGKDGTAPYSTILGRVPRTVWSNLATDHLLCLF